MAVVDWESELEDELGPPVGALASIPPTSGKSAGRDWDSEIATELGPAPKAVTIPQGDVLAKAFDAMQNLGRRDTVLGILRSLPKERHPEFLQAAQVAAGELGKDRSNFPARMIQGIHRGLTHDIAQPVAELIGAGGTEDEIATIRKLDEIAAGTIEPALPTDPWYTRGPIQAARMAPAALEMVAGGELATGAVKGLGLATKAAQAFGKGRKAVRLAEIAGIAGTAFPAQYAQEVDSLKEAGVTGPWQKPIAALTALAVGAIESIVPNPFKVGKTPLYKGTIAAVKGYLFEAVKKYPGELSEEYLQGLASGLGRVVATHLDEKAPDQGLGSAFLESWKQGNQAIIPLAFMMGAPAAVGAIGAGLAARVAARDGIPTRTEAKELRIPPEEARSAPSRRAWFEENMGRLQEQYDAQQVSEAGPDNEGGGARPQVREEDGNPPVSGEGVPGRGPGEGQTEEAVAAKEPWQMTRDDLAEAVNAKDRPSLEVARPLLAAMFPEYTAEDDPWGIYRAVSRGDELPRVPMVDFTKRHREQVQKALAEGKPVPPEVLAEYPELQQKAAPPVGEAAPAEEVAPPEPAPAAEPEATIPEEPGKPGRRSPYEVAARRYAKEKKLDPDTFLGEADRIAQADREKWEAKRIAKKACHDFTGLTAEMASELANKGFGPGFKKKAGLVQSGGSFAGHKLAPTIIGRKATGLAKLDEAGFLVRDYPQGFGEEAKADPVQAVWDLMLEEHEREVPRVNDPEILKAAEAAMTKPVDTSFDPEKLDAEALRQELIGAVMPQGAPEPARAETPKPVQPTRTGTAWEAAKASRDRVKAALGDVAGTFTAGLGEEGSVGDVDPERRAKQLELVSAVADMVVKHVVASGEEIKDRTYDFGRLVADITEDLGRAGVAKIKPLLRKHWDVIAGKWGLEAAPEETAADIPRITSIKRRIIDELASGIGLDDLPPFMRESFPQYLNEAEERFLDDEHWFEKSMAEIRATKRPMDKIDVAGANLYVRLKFNELGEAIRKAREAEASGDASAAVEAATAKDLATAAIKEVREVKDVGVREAARAVASAKIELFEDFTEASLIVQLESSKGGKAASREESAKVADIAAKDAELTEKVGASRRTAAVEDFIKSSAPKGGRRSTERAAAARKKIDGAKARWAALAHKVVSEPEVFGGMPVSPKLIASAPEALSIAKDLVTGYFELGAVTFKTFMRKAAADLGDWVSDSRDAFSVAWKTAADAGEIKPPSVDAKSRSSLAVFACRVARSFVQSGTRDAQQLVDEVWPVLQEIKSDITRLQTWHILGGYGDIRLPSKETVDVEMRRIHSELQREAILDSLKKKIAPLRSGKQRDKLSDKARQIQEQINELKRRGGYEVTDPETQQASALDAIKRGVRNRIVDKRTEMATGERIVKEKTPITSDAELDALRKLNEEVTEEHRKKFPPKPPSMEQKLASAEKAVDRAIAELQKDLDAGMLWRDKPGKLTSEQLEKKRAFLEELKDRRQKLRDAADPNRDWRAAQERQIAEYKRMMAEGDVLPEKRAERKLSKAEVKLLYEKTKNRERFKDMQRAAEWERMDTVQRALNLIPAGLNLIKGLKATFDVSMTGRQGLIEGIMHPLLGGKALAKGILSFCSRENHFGAMEELKRNPDFHLAWQAGLGIVDETGLPGEQAEQFSGAQAERIAGWAKSGSTAAQLTTTPARVVAEGMAGSERSATRTLNTLRMGAFSTLIRTCSRTGVPTLAEAKVIANAVNIFTAKGHMGATEKASMPLARLVFWTPSMIKSRLQFLYMEPLWHGAFTKEGMKWQETKWARAGLAMEYVRFGIGMATLVALANIFGRMVMNDEDGWPTVNLDPGSGEFMRFRWGQHTIDLSGGIGQYVRLLWRLAPGWTGMGTKTSQHGQVTEMTGENRVKDFGNMLRYKLTPAAGLLYDVAISGEHPGGQPISAASVAGQLTVPLNITDIVQAFVTDANMPRATAVSLAGTIGLSVANYERSTTGSKKADKVFEAWYAANPRDDTMFPGIPSNEYTKDGKKHLMTEAQHLLLRETAREVARQALDEFNPVPLRVEKPTKALAQFIRNVALKAREKVRDQLIDQWTGTKPIAALDISKLGREAVEGHLASRAWTVARPERLSRDSEGVREARKAAAYLTELGVDKSRLSQLLQRKLRKQGKSVDAAWEWGRRLRLRVGLP